MKTIKELKLQSKINSLSFDTLCDVWNHTERQITSEESFIIRESIMERLEAINQDLFVKWLDSCDKDILMFKGCFK